MCWCCGTHNLLGARDFSDKDTALRQGRSFIQVMMGSEQDIKWTVLSLLRSRGMETLCRVCVCLSPHAYPCVATGCPLLSLPTLLFETGLSLTLGLTDWLGGLVVRP